MIQEDKIYRDLQIHLNNLPIGFPPSENGADIKVLKAFFSPDEALLATYLDFYPISLENICSKVKALGISLDEVESVLDSMVQKRLIYEEVNPETNTKSYGNLPYAIGFFETHIKSK